MPPGAPNLTAELKASAGEVRRPRGAKKNGRPPAAPDSESPDEFPEMGASVSPFGPPAEAKPKAATGAPQKNRAADYIPVDPFDPEVFNRQYHGTDEG